MSHPTFSKFFTSRRFSEKMTLPSTFTRHIQGLPELVVLTDENNNFWQVKVEKVGENTYFHEGWVTFQEDNLVKKGELIVFKYLCEGMFSVKLFDVRDCEKKAPGKFIFKGIGWKKNKIEVNERVKKEVPDEDYIEVVYPEEENEEGDGNEDIYEDNEDDEMGGEEEEVGDSKEEVEEEDYGYKDIDEEEEEEDEKEDEEEVEEECARVKEDGSDTNGRRRRYKRIISDSDEDDIGEKPLRKRRITNKVDAGIFGSRLADKPKNPYFFAQVTSRKSELYVPISFVGSHAIHLKKVTYLLDPKGKKSWYLKYRTWKGGRVIYTGQWREFCKHHNLKKDDMCICELIKGRRGHYLKVKIVLSK